MQISLRKGNFNSVVPKSLIYSKSYITLNIDKSYMLENNYETEWLDEHIPNIVKILDIDAMMTIPLSVPLKGPGMVVTPQDFEKAVQKITKNL